MIRLAEISTECEDLFPANEKQVKPNKIGFRRSLEVENFASIPGLVYSKRVEVSFASDSAKLKS